MNLSHKNQVKQSLQIFEEVSQKKCFTNELFLQQTDLVKKKLNNFRILHYEIYGAIIKETIATIIAIILIILRIMPFKTLLFILTKTERKVNKKLLIKAQTDIDEKENEKREENIP